ncbi:hypothetical protein ACJX0J_017091, partial [Zea mays]
SSVGLYLFSISSIYAHIEVTKNTKNIINDDTWLYIESYINAHLVWVVVEPWHYSSPATPFLKLASLTMIESGIDKKLLFDDIEKSSLLTFFLANGFTDDNEWGL